MMSIDTHATPTSSATEVMTEYLASAKRGDWDAAYGLLAKDMTVHIPGESAFAGEHHGREAAIEYIQAIRNHFMNGGIELEVVHARDHPPRERLPRARRRDRRDLDLRG